MKKLALLRTEITECTQCDRLVAWCTQVAREKRRAYRDQTYWGKPVPGFGDPNASLIIVGLAPGAHGANRTGRVFTGDRSGDFLYAALHRAKLASQPNSDHANDGLTLRGVFITLACRCAPPDNHPTRDELAACTHFLSREIALFPKASTFLALGKIAYDAVAALSGVRIPDFGHGVYATLPHPTRPKTTAHLFASYHVSQQNTQTGRLTPAMFDQVVTLAARAAGLC
ncbi:MAG: uracil-DNA glycosylase [Polyangiaceae bacterium]|nr:uracil-DNA glycosylase [Polyangiaceae bacterium]